MGISVQKFIQDIGEFVWGLPTLFLIVTSGVILSFGNSFFQFRYFLHWIKNTVGTLFSKKNPHIKSDSRQISGFQAVCGALASTIGTGNISGVAMAISAGGPGAVFWMWISAVFGMMTSYSEIVLGMNYRVKDISGRWCGGPMYYLRDGLGKRMGMKYVGKILACLFCFFCIFASFGMGNMVQANTISDVLRLNYNVPPLYTGLTLSCISSFVIFGGIKRIGTFMEKLVPFMSIFYIICAFSIFLMNFKSIPYVFSSIFENAFSTRSILGGAGGIAIKQSIALGFKRGIFSNEAGLGSGVIMHTSSDTKEPAVQGMWGIFSVFVDTVIICSLTAFVILSTTCEPVSLSEGLENISEDITYISIKKDARGKIPLADTQANPLFAETNDGEKIFGLSNTNYTYTNVMALRGIREDKDGNTVSNKRIPITRVVLEEIDGITLVAYAFALKLGKWSENLLVVAIVLLAFSTVIGWSYYGEKAWEFLLGSSSPVIYKMIYIIFIIFGSVMSLKTVWELSDIFNALMSVPNLIGVIGCSSTVFNTTKDYIRRKIKC
ncbi:MAG: alanine:cation symporter family protein [Clostridia bacterium]|nr:alanine:cation symporter family protein [Clostridia bacterium]